MYYAIVAAFAVVLPVASILVDALMSSPPIYVVLIGKWFVFWAVGVRLLTAGIRQMLHPEFTAKNIFEMDDPGALKIVAELGVSNISIGILGVASLHFKSWVVPSALYGLIFFGLAGIRHIANQKRNALETVATVSDIWIAMICLIYLAAKLHDSFSSLYGP
jgi:hypothetical protein